MSPEQITGQTVDSRADLYSLGIVFYEMLTKELPYQAEEVLSLAMMHCKEPIPRLPDEVAAFQPILDRVTAKDPNDRFADAGELVRALDQVALDQVPRPADEATRVLTPGQPSASRTDDEASRVRPKRAGLLAGLLVLLIGGGAGVYFLLAPSPPPAPPDIEVDLPPAPESRSAISINYEKLALEHLRVGEREKSLELIKLGLVATPRDERLRVLQNQVQRDLEIEHLRARAIELADKNQFDQSLQTVLRGLALAPDRQDLSDLRDELQSRLQEKRLARANEVFEQANELQDSGYFDESLSLIDQGLEIEPDHHGLLALRYEVQGYMKRREEVDQFHGSAAELLEAGRLEDGLSQIDEGLRLAPDSAELQRLRAKILERQGQLRNERIQDLLEQAVSLQQQHPDRSLALVEEGLSTVPAHAELLRLEDSLHQRIEQREAIEKLYQEAQELRQGGRLDESLALIRNALELEPENPGLLELQASIEGLKRQIEDQQAVSKLLAQAREKRRLGALDEAMVLVERGLSLEPEFEELKELQLGLQKEIDAEREVARWISEAEAAADKGAAEKGLQLVDRALELDPGNQRAAALQALISDRQALARQKRVTELLEKAKDLEARDRLADSLTVVEQGLEIEPEDQHLQELREQIAAKIEARDRLTRLLDGCAERYPIGPQLRFLATPALDCYQKILDSDPENATAAAKYREIAGQLPTWTKKLLQEGDLGQAEKLVALLSQLKPRHGELPALRRALSASREEGLELDLNKRKQIQVWMNTLGYAAGEADGSFGAKTRRAIRTFQTDIESDVTGYLTKDVLDSLEDQGRRQIGRSRLPRMIDIAGGCFQMGSQTSEAHRDSDERPHQVCVQGFRLGEREVTVGEFGEFVEATGYRTDAERNAAGYTGCWALDVKDDEPWSYRDWANWRQPHKYEKTRHDHPVTCVSWNDAQAYVDWLSKESKMPVRLPTEAEWEYAARSGTSGTRFWGNNADDSACQFASIADVGHEWDNGFACDDGYEWVAPVGKKLPNLWGLYDVLGNASEWTCSDYDPEYKGAETSCTAADSEVPRVLRGGSWFSGPSAVRAAYRDRNFSGARYNFLGFRIAEDAEGDGLTAR
jgi:serine/threonine-protein kinase PpkA